MNDGVRTDANEIELEGQLLADPSRFGFEGTHLVRCVIVTDVPPGGRALHQLQFRGEHHANAALRLRKGRRVRVRGQLIYDMYQIEGKTVPLAVTHVEEILHPPMLVAH